ncbi:MAG: ABC transporter ATP-binding protein [Nitrososphaerales archaeon]
MNNILSLTDVKVYFQIRKGFLGSSDVRAVDGVSLGIRNGETVAIVGESGSGKTTLGRVALRLLEPTSGSIVFQGKDISHASEGSLGWLRRLAQPIFQDPYSSIDTFMNIYQIIEEPLVIHGIGTSEEKMEMVRKSLRDVRLTPEDDFILKYPHQLSGGQRQRVSMARALVLEPKFIVADEPVSMIDASSRAEILLLLKELQESKGISFLYITHDIATARHFADRIAVMYLGRLVEIGLPLQIIEDPLHPYTKALIEAVPDADPSNRLRERKVIPGEPASPKDIPSGCRFHPRCEYAIKGKCEQDDAYLNEVKPEHFVACHLY